jgi:hypothetical protein
MLPSLIEVKKGIPVPVFPVDKPFGKVVGLRVPAVLM